MANNNYRRGVDFERKVKNWLEEMGWLAARTAGSHGLADVLAVSNRSRELYLIQCKTGSASLTKTERIGFARWAEDYGATAFLATPSADHEGGIRFRLIDYTGDMLEYDMRQEVYFNDGR